MKVFLPERSEDLISNDLRNLTKILSMQNVKPASGLLGGEYGYGAFFENDVFMMHPFCWCEQEDCLWCVSCECSDEIWTYQVDGIPCSFSVYCQTDYNSHFKELIVDETLQCAFCKEEVELAPNFLHKESGSFIKWNKYIGRDMEVTLLTNWDLIITDCLNSLESAFES